MATQQKIAEFKEFVRNVKDSAMKGDLGPIPRSWIMTEHNGKSHITLKLENAFDMGKVSERIGGIEKCLNHKGIGISRSYEDEEVFAIGALKAAKNDRRFLHYTQIGPYGVHVTIDAEGMRILRLIEECLV